MITSTDVPVPCSIATTIERYGRMMTVKELAPLLGMSIKTLYARVKRGEQPAALIGDLPVPELASDHGSGPRHHY
jgi:hypothetical protein